MIDLQYSFAGDQLPFGPPFVQERAEGELFLSMQRHVAGIAAAAVLFTAGLANDVAAQDQADTVDVERVEGRFILRDESGRSALRDGDVLRGDATIWVDVDPAFVPPLVIPPQNISLPIWLGAENTQFEVAALEVEDTYELKTLYSTPPEVHSFAPWDNKEDELPGIRRDEGFFDPSVIIPAPTVAHVFEDTDVLARVLGADEGFFDPSIIDLPKTQAVVFEDTDVIARFLGADEGFFDPSVIVLPPVIAEAFEATGDLVSSIGFDEGFFDPNVIILPPVVTHVFEDTDAWVPQPGDAIGVDEGFFDPSIVIPAPVIAKVFEDTDSRVPPFYLDEFFFDPHVIILPPVVTTVFSTEDQWVPPARIDEGFFDPSVIVLPKPVLEVFEGDDEWISSIGFDEGFFDPSIVVPVEVHSLISVDSQIVPQPPDTIFTDEGFFDVSLVIPIEAHRLPIWMGAEDKLAIITVREDYPPNTLLVVPPEVHTLRVLEEELPGEFLPSIFSDEGFFDPTVIVPAPVLTKVFAVDESLGRDSIPVSYDPDFKHVIVLPKAITPEFNESGDVLWIPVPSGNILSAIRVSGVYVFRIKITPQG